MFNKFNSHPQPGTFDDKGRLITTDAQKDVARVRKVTASGIGGPGDAPSMGGGGLQGGGFGSGFQGSNGGTGMSLTNFSGGGSGGFGSSPIVDRYNPVRDRLDEGSVVEDWIPRDASGLDEMFRLMYHRDAIAGPVVDLISDLIWTDYDLTGIEDPAIRKVYEDCLSTIDIMEVLPHLTREFLVLGRTVSSMVFDKSRGIFNDLTSYDPSFLRLTPIPIRGMDPMIDLIPGPGLRAFVESKDARAIDARKMLPDAFIQAIKAGGNQGVSNSASNFGIRQDHHSQGSAGIPLDPVNTLFLARRVFNYDYIGTSLYTRLITFWALEKALINATVTSARRRSRSILHISAGLDNLWEPSVEELDNIAGMFISADEDPVGAVVVTRNGVSANEVRQGSDFYKWSDEWQMLSEGKMRALGVNEALLSGDSTYNNQDAARMFFMEKAQALRNHITQRVLYKRVFPLLARVNGFRKKSKADLDHKIGDSLTQRESMSIPESELIMPTIEFRKDLVSNFDEKRLEMLEKAETKGLPVSLRAFASAANMDLDAMISDMENDSEIRRRVALWKARSENAVQDEEATAKMEFVNSLRSLTHSNLNTALGSTKQDLGPLASYIFWDKEGKIAELSAKDLASFLKTISPNDNSSLILVDGLALKSRLLAHFQNSVKAETAHYLIYRTGLTPTIPALSEPTQDAIAKCVKASLDQYALHGSVYQLGKVAEEELKIVMKLGAAYKAQAHARLEDTVSRITKGKESISNSSKNIYSGSTKY